LELEIKNTPSGVTREYSTATIGRECPWHTRGTWGIVRARACAIGDRVRGDRWTRASESEAQIEGNLETPRGGGDDDARGGGERRRRRNGARAAM
jgi:hypothetical protein